MADIRGIRLDDDLIARTIQGFSSEPVLPLAPIPLGLSSPHSTIEEVAPLYTPILMPPKENIMLKVIGAHQETERLAGKRTQAFEAESAVALAEIDRLSLEKEEAFRQELEAAKSRDSWSTIASVAQYITSFGSVVLGMTVGGVPGFLIGASGVIGGALRLTRDTHLLDPAVEWYTKSVELQTSIKEQIDMGATYLQLGLGLAGGAAAWYTGALAAHATDYLTKLPSVIAATGQAAKTGAELGKAYHNKRIADVNANAKELELDISEQRQTLTHQTKEIGEVLDADESELEQIRKAIQRQEVEFS